MNSIMLSPTRQKRDPYDFPLLSPLNTDDLHRRSFDDNDNYEDLSWDKSWDDSFERAERMDISDKPKSRAQSGLKKIKTKVSRPVSASVMNSSVRSRIKGVPSTAALNSTIHTHHTARTPHTPHTAPTPHTISTRIPTISTALISERRRKIEEDNRIFSLKVQEDAERMHQHLMRDIEDMNEICSFMGVLALYCIRSEDRDLVRNGRECGQPFILRKVKFDDDQGEDNSRSTSTSTTMKGNKLNITLGKVDRLLTMNTFLKEYGYLRIEAAKIRSVQPIRDAVSTRTNRIKSINDSLDDNIGTGRGVGTGRETVRDTGRNTGRESGFNSGRETEQNVGQNVGHNTGRSTGRDTGRKTGNETGRDTLKDTGILSGMLTAREAGRLTGRDSPGRSSTGREIGREIGRDIGMAADRGGYERPMSAGRFNGSADTQNTTTTQSEKSTTSVTEKVLISDTLDEAHLSGGRLLASLLDRESETHFHVAKAPVLEEYHSAYNKPPTHPAYNTHNTQNKYTHHTHNIDPPTREEQQQNIEYQQRRVLDQTVAIAKQVEEQIAEIKRRGWNLH